MCIYQLITEEDFNNVLGEINLYLPKFLENIRNNPKTIADIILKADKNDLKKHLAPFITHNLYFNISNDKNDQILYIITLLLKEEFKSLNKIDSNFLSDSRCGIIFEEFKKKKEVKLFFKTIILDIIKKLENLYNVDIEFDPETIKEKLNESNNDDGYFKNNIDNNKSKLIDNYIFTSFCIDQLNEKLLEYKDNDMKDFIQKIIKDCSSSSECFENIFLNKIYDEEDKSEKLMNYFRNSFTQMIELINMLIDNLLKNCDLLPY